MTLYQNRRNGQIVELISYHDADYAMVKNQSGAISYPLRRDLEEYQPGHGRTGVTLASAADGSGDNSEGDAPPAPTIPADTRLNVNTATAEAIAAAIKGVGYSTAKKIVELRMSLPGEKFINLEQLKQVGRVDWEQVLAEDLIYVA
jgi:competence ComEA-like helix-hairpin-helix protein